ncbi:hypothetical protein [Prosthecomicrobium hirschii]|uniref:hypothetical protein n=1 Tax=Prosthecodimorpha hirschii TaxID=665126 RepID=UPI00128FC58B|nr:hypothetical protein [Prosthecomicrobium hirschii]
MDICGRVVRSPEFLPLKPILRKWSRCIAIYSDRHCGKYAAYYFGERTNVSILNAASWIAGAVSIEEYALEKGQDMDTYNGRADLYIQADNQCFSVEAKHCWDNIHAPKRSILIRNKIKECIRDARNVDEGLQVAITFIAPECESKRHKEFLENPRTTIKTYIKALNSEFSGAGFLAWSFPNSNLMTKGSNQNYWPGVVMIGYGVDGII